MKHVLVMLVVGTLLSGAAAAYAATHAKAGEAAVPAGALPPAR